MQPADILRWTLLNEAERARDGILLRGFSEIEFAIRSIVREEMDKHTNPVKKWKYFQEHRKAFDYVLSHDAFEKYGKGIERAKTAEVLTQHMESFAKEANINLAAYPDKKQHMEQSILQTSAIMVECETKMQANAQGLMHQQQQAHAVQEVQQQQLQQAKAHAQVNTDYKENVEAKYAENQLSLTGKELSEESSVFHSSLNVYFGVSFFGHNLYIMHNAAYTIYNEKKQKPNEFFLLTSEEGKTKYFLISMADAMQYRADLRNGQMSRKAALFSVDGKLCQNGKDGFCSDELKALQESAEFKDAVLQFELVNGKLSESSQSLLKPRYPSYLKKIQQFWEKQAGNHIDPEGVDNSY